MSLVNYKITDNFFLSNQKLRTVEATSVLKKTQTNFIFVVDVSGSMYGELGNIRKQLKNKLPSLMNAGDTISIIWFSGYKQAGILKEEVEISSLSSFDDLNKAIDRWLTPQGATAFDTPLVITKDVIGRIKKNRPEGLYSLIFLSDGCHNSGSWSDVKSALKGLDKELSTATFIEYGYYADSRALTEMAEILGGDKIEAENFDKFEPVFSDKLSNTVTSKKEIVTINGELKYPFVYTITDNNEIVVFSVNDKNEALINSNLTDIYFFTEKASTKAFVKFDEKNEALVKSLYSAIYVLSDRTLNQDAEFILASLGDTSLYNIFSNAYGKQKLNNFKNSVKDMIGESAKRFIKGRSENIVIDENAYCVLDLLRDLSNSDENLFYPYNENFKYNRIGAARISKAGKLDADDKKLLTEVDNVADLKKLVEELENKSGDELKFENTDKDKGFRINELVYNDERANVSVRAKYNGYVNLPKNNYGLTKIDTFIYRNYTLIKDGIINVGILPMSLEEETFNILQEKGVIAKHESFEEGRIYLLDLNAIPVINRSLTRKLSAKKLAEAEFNLLKNKASSKVYSYYEKLHFPKESKGFIEQYGKEAEEWLKSLGITEFNGFNPSMETAESQDFYMSVNLKTKIKGYSSLPKVNEVEAKIRAKKPLKSTELLLEPYVREYIEQIESPLYMTQTEEMQKSILKAWLTKAKIQEVKNKRNVMNDISRLKFSLILSRGWFVEFASFEENVISIDIDSQKVETTFELKEEEVKI